MTTLITNIAQLISTRTQSHVLRGKELAEMPASKNAFLLIEDGIIAGYGHMEELRSIVPQLPEIIIDAAGQFVLPCWCDSHSHIVFSGSRENEFVNKIRGLSYAEIAARGGGILNSAKKINDISEDDLFKEAWERLEAVGRLGTGAIEIKSGYGLTLAGELKMLRVIKKLKQRSPLTIRATFLGAHTYPLEFRDNHQGYIDLIIHEMLPAIAAEKLADYIDVFCETGFFSPAETDIICRAGISHGLKPKLHVNQLNSIGGIEAGQKLNAVSLDHLETLTDREIKLLSNPEWNGLCTLLPTAAFFCVCPINRRAN